MNYIRLFDRNHRNYIRTIILQKILTTTIFIWYHINTPIQDAEIKKRGSDPNEQVIRFGIRYFATKTERRTAPAY